MLAPRQTSHSLYSIWGERRVVDARGRRLACRVVRPGASLGDRYGPDGEGERDLVRASRCRHLADLSTVHGSSARQVAILCAKGGLQRGTVVAAGGVAQSLADFALVIGH